MVILRDIDITRTSVAFTLTRHYVACSWLLFILLTQCDRCHLVIWSPNLIFNIPLIIPLVYIYALCFHSYCSLLFMVFHLLIFI